MSPELDRLELSPSNLCLALATSLKTTHSCLGLDGILSLGEVSLSLLLLLGDSAGVLLAQLSADGASLLGSEIEREVLLLLVEQAQLVSLVGVDDGQDSSDRLAEVVSN